MKGTEMRRAVSGTLALLAALYCAAIAETRGIMKRVVEPGLGEAEGGRDSAVGGR